jgi:hypothetical protein
VYRPEVADLKAGGLDRLDAPHGTAATEAPIATAHHPPLGCIWAAWYLSVADPAGGLRFSTITEEARCAVS